MVEKAKTYRYSIILILVIVISLLLRVLPILHNNFPFTTDQGRDMLDIRKIVVGRDIALIGPTTSINGVYLGPFWYYFNVPPFIAGNGDPAFLVYWMILWYLIAGILFWVTLKKSNPTLAILGSVLFLMSPALFYSSRFSWSANPMPIFTAFFFLSLLNQLHSPSRNKSFLTGLITGLSMQIEAAFGVLFFPFLIATQLIKRVPFKNILFSILGFALTLIPQALFEVKHNFVMTKVFLNEISGKSAILGDKLSFPEIVSDHLHVFQIALTGQLELPATITLILLAGSVIWLGYLFVQKKLSSMSKLSFWISLSFIIFAFCFYLLYSHPLKGWYVMGLAVPTLLLVATALTELFSLKKKFLTWPLIIGLSLLFINALFVQTKLIPHGSQDRSSDPSNLRNEIEVIDAAYGKTQGVGFKAFNYIPSVYDFPYQYLYWWHGTKQYGYLPAVLSYLENVPEYITDNEKFLQQKKALTPDSKTVLIIEPDKDHQERLYAWQGNFAHLCKVDEYIFYWQTKIQILEECKK